jgi:hypothetical protein
LKNPWFSPAKNPWISPEKMEKPGKNHGWMGISPGKSWIYAILWLVS